jgi:hypothetical protein
VVWQAQHFLSSPLPWTGPWYSGDGIGERYLDRVHKNGVDLVVLELNDFVLSLNETDPRP